MRVGLAGSGRIGELHARTLRDSPHVSHLLIHDVRPERARAVAEGAGASVVEDLDDLLRRADALVIAAPTNLHTELIRAGVEADLAVFCEKPIALDLETTDDTVRLVRQTGAPVQIGFQRRFDAGYRAARDRVAAGAVGEVYLVRAMMHDPEPPPSEYLAASGGVYVDMHIHDFDAIRFVTGREILEVFADGSARGFEEIAAHDDAGTTAAVLRLEDGILAQVSGTRRDARGYDIRMEVIGSRDSIGVGYDARTPLRSVEPDGSGAPDASSYDDFVERFGSAYQAELHAFVDLARGTGDNACPVDDAREALRAALACELSCRERRPVSLKEIA